MTIYQKFVQVLSYYVRYQILKYYIEQPFDLLRKVKLTTNNWSK